MQVLCSNLFPPTLMLQWSAVSFFPLHSIVCLPLFFFLFVLPEEESETAAAAAAETAEVDARSIYVGNVSFLLLLCRFS